MKIYKKKLCAHTFGSITAGKDSSNSQRCNPFVPPVIFLSNGVVKGLGVSYGLQQGCMGSYAGTLVQSTYVLHIHPNTIQGYMGSYAGLNGGYLSSSTRRYLTTFYAKTQHVGPSGRTIFTSPLQDSTMATSIDNIYHIYLLDITHLKEVEEDLLFFGSA